MGVKGVFALYLCEFKFLSVQLGNNFGPPMLGELREFLIYVYFFHNKPVHPNESWDPVSPLVATNTQVKFQPTCCNMQGNWFPAFAGMHGYKGMLATECRNLDFDLHFLIDHISNHHCRGGENIAEMLFNDWQNFFDIFAV